MRATKLRYRYFYSEKATAEVGEEHLNRQAID